MIFKTSINILGNLQSPSQHLQLPDMPAMKEDKAIDFCFFGQQILVFLQIADRPRNECGDYRTAVKSYKSPRNAA